MTIVDIVAAASLVVQTIYAAATFHRDRPRETQPDAAKRPARPVIIVSLLMLTTWAAVGFGYWDRHYNAPPLIIESVIESWGVAGIPPTGVPLYSILVNSAPLETYSADYKLMLIARVTWATVDRMTDTAIEKSALYTITGDSIMIQHAGQGKIRFPINGPGYAELNLVLVPNGFAPEQITCLQDILKIGGKILGHPSQAVTGAASQASSPVTH